MSSTFVDPTQKYARNTCILSYIVVITRLASLSFPIVPGKAILARVVTVGCPPLLAIFLLAHLMVSLSAAEMGSGVVVPRISPVGCYSRGLRV